MVKNVRAAAVTLAAFTFAALACLAGCSLGAGIFPDRLMSYEAYTDLARFIDPEHIWGYNFQIIRNSSSGAEYLVLADDNGSYGDDCVVVFDTDLKVLGHYTLRQLDDMNDAVDFGGRGAMVDESGRIVVGNRRFTVEPHRLSYRDRPPALHNLGLCVPDAFDRNLADIRCDVQNLVFERYNKDWTLITSTSMQLSLLSWHKVVGIWHAGTEVLLVVQHDSDPYYGHVLAMDGLAFSTGGLGTPLLEQPFARAVPSNTDIEWQTLGYTDEGFVAFRRSSNEYYRFDEFGTELEASGEIPEDKRPWDQRHVYGRTSGWYVMDMKEMTLERRKWWWK